eukprot:CAMPEP_0198371478 /NCGR_PEP_ID=MMETSP1450-20131203/157248_1 /TAXON_ID=753684 ORGANISM="Madagascaria erythrocladiodes, Strain CCMP3234" /NCGR_SAMPLE_ID=MMETSP1450 /ASSEMBLY_ACC=CAM_ASM_001115 /LENGTH=34 /DNA_ID= /DNA_START= /DNA_END= /DNA_ORIENTATION=
MKLRLLSDGNVRGSPKKEQDDYARNKSFCARELE